MKIEAQLRENTGKSIANKLRFNGLIPGIVYGGEQNYNITLSEKSMNRFIRSNQSSKLVEIEIDDKGAKQNKTVVLQDYQQAICKDQIKHVDFREVTPNTVLEVVIPIHPVGVSKAVKLGGVVQIVRHAIPVKCRAADMVEHIEIDVTDLDFGGSIHVLDVKFPKGISPVITGRNYTIMTLGGSSAAQEPEPVADPVAADKPETGAEADKTVEEDKKTKK